MKVVQYIRNNMFRFILICLMIGLTSPVIAQTSGDKLFSQGIELQKSQTVKSQKSAIQKFLSAKKIFDSAAKKKQCDDAIMVSNNIIRTINNKNNRKPDPEPIPEPEKKPILELSNENLHLDYEGHTVIISVTTSEPEWNIAQIANNEGLTFVSVNSQSEKNEFEIVCPSNKSTIKRSQTIEVRSGELKKTLLIEQSGKPVSLSVEKAVVEIAYRGGSKSILVYSNSDSKEVDNNYRNWKVISSPEWVTVIGEEYIEKGFLSKLKEKETNTKKNAGSIDDSSVKTSVMKVVVASKPKNDPSRTGEIIISSEGQRATIIVHQK